MRPRTAIIVAIAGLVLAGAAVLWFTGRESPDAVDIDRAVTDAAALPGQPREDEASSGTEAAVITDPTGTWAVDTEAVAFDGATGSGTWVGYRIDEELSGVGAFTAVGRSPRVGGEVVIEGDRVVSADIRADLVGLVSDNANRDRRVSPIFTDRPVTFSLSAPVEFGGVPDEGQRIAVSARGVLRIGDIARDVDVELSADIVGSLLVVTGSTVVTLADFGVSVPSAPIVLRVSEEATVELQLFLSRD